ncbi:MAG TPA: Sir2 family NAD-dependent protein deacetylase [Ferruginibacter sp.]|nr:Sir2 family NAD-dependent protein deacetylase [Ferruginibacter sp.]HRO18527.1 Sir2 family NAD-dependent protein deacetylase [Ferruginibacter sp.]HRQ21288.1 Sir2 family NAD-dependent protein deacetylase [Ferruginibacter sp.]
MSTLPHLVVLSGAGISAESGLKTFRDSDGLWNGYAIEEVATPRAFAKHPQLVLDFYNMRRREVLKASPNAAHIGIASLEQYFRVTVVTQNVDDLHERGGSSNVLHLHGEILKMRGEGETTVYEIKGDIHVGDCSPAGNPLRPHIVWFEEPVPMIEEAAAVCSTADVFVVIGTSLQVYPAAGLLSVVGDDVPKYIIDRVIPSVHNYKNIHPIEMNATSGVQELIQRLMTR